MTFHFRSAAVEAELITRRAPVSASSFDAETRQLSVVFATSGAAVERWDMDGAYIEILDIGGWRLREGVVPFLDNHRRDSIGDQLGVVISSETVGGTARAVVQLSRHHPLADRIAGDLSDGMRFGVSVGYWVERWKTETDKKTGVRTKTAVKWTVHEISAVAVPADRHATTRSAMTERTTPAQPENPAPAPATPQMPAAAPAGITTRAEINREIRTLGRATGAASSAIDDLIDRQASVDDARRTFLDTIVQRTAGAPGSTPLAQIGQDHTDPVSIRSAMADAIAHRLSPRQCKLEGRALGFAGYRMLDMVGELANARGDHVNLRDQNALMERAVGAHSTSDFPLLLSEAANKSLLANYQAAAPTYRRWAARRTFNDFRDHNFLRVGDFPEFKDVGESGEVKYGTISENREQVRAKELGTGIVVGRRLLINDDLSALADFSSMIAIRAAADENKRVYALLTGTPVLSDTKALFHADHGNLAAAAAAVSSASAAIAVSAIRKQKSLDGLVLNLSPRFLIVGPDKEMEGRQLLAAITAAKASDVNPWAGSMELVVDANITGNGWYIGVEPEAAPSIVYGYVSGAEGPQIRTEVDFDTRAVKVAAGLDFGCGVIDFRGLFKNAGA